MRFRLWMAEISGQINFSKCDEIFNTKNYKENKPKKINYYLGDYVLEFEVDGNEYVFIAFDKGDDEWAIGFERKDKPGQYELINSKDYLGKLVVLLLRSTKKLISDKKVKSFIFNTSERQLKRIYNNIPKYIKKETGYSLQNVRDLGYVTAWKYTK